MGGGVSDGIAYFLCPAGDQGRSSRGRTTRPGTPRSRWPRGAAKNRQGLREISSDARLESPGSSSRTQTADGHAHHAGVGWSGIREVEPAGLGHLALEHEAASALEKARQVWVRIGTLLPEAVTATGLVEISIVHIGWLMTEG